MVRFESVGLRYGTSAEGSADALQNVAFSVSSGGFRWLIGPAGSGKTSILRLACFVVLPTWGKVMAMGTAHNAGRGALASARLRIGAILSDWALLPHLSVFDNVALPLRIGRIPESTVQTDVREMLAWANIGHLSDRLPADLSSSERRLTEIARAVVVRPGLLVADEPTDALDDKQTQRLMQLIQELNNVGTTVLVATKDAGLIDRYPAATVRLERGRVVDAP